MKLQGIKLIIGLGNPGSQYALTYHNVGFLTVDYLKKYQVSPKQNKFATGQASIKYKVCKSNTYMNLSGSFVNKAIKKHKIKPEEVLIVHDDSDINLGKYKFSFSRGSAGHKGIESIIKALKTKNFWRLRIGIRPKKVSMAKAGLPAIAQRAKAGNFVLKKITKKDFAVFNEVFQEAQKTISPLS